MLDQSARVGQKPGVLDCECGHERCGCDGCAEALPVPVENERGERRRERLDGEEGAARKETVAFSEHASVEVEDKQGVLRSAAQRVTSIPSSCAAKAAANATLRGNVSLARIPSAIGASGARLESG